MALSHAFASLGEDAPARAGTRSFPVFVQRVHGVESLDLLVGVLDARGAGGGLQPLRILGLRLSALVKHLSLLGAGGGTNTLSPGSRRAAVLAGLFLHGDSGYRCWLRVGGHCDFGGGGAWCLGGGGGMV